MPTRCTCASTNASLAASIPALGRARGVADEMPARHEQVSRRPNAGHPLFATSRGQSGHKRARHSSVASSTRCRVHRRSIAPGWHALQLGVGVALAVARLGVGSAAATHSYVARLDRPRLVPGWVIEVDLYCRWRAAGGAARSGQSRAPRPRGNGGLRRQPGGAQPRGRISRTRQRVPRIPDTARVALRPGLGC